VKLTAEQNSIIELVASGKDNLLVSALAGAGKTSTILMSLASLPQKTALLCAFNKRIADELTARMPPCPKGSVWKAQTFHAIGLQTVSHHRRGIEVNKEATEDLINDAIALFVKHGKPADKISFQGRRAAVNLLRTLKEIHVNREVFHDHVVKVGYEYDLFGKISGEEIDRTVSTVRLAYKASQDLKNRKSIDFCDMTWLPVVLDLAPPSRYQTVFVDEAQDLSMPQLLLVKKYMAPNGRIIAVGDKNQGIYSWRGAVGDYVWNEMREVFKAKSLPLTTTFRCSRAVVKQAQQIVPTLTAREDAPQGSISSCTFEQLAGLLKAAWEIHTFVLSRNNADLLQTALHLWKSGVGFQLAAGKEIVEPLYEIIDKLDKLSKARFSSSLATWFAVEMSRAEKANASAWAERIEQQYGMLSVMLQYAEPVSFKKVLGDILGLSISAIILSTVHKVKGLEADRIYLLKQTFARYQVGRKKPPTQEDLNIEYVAITRAKQDLIWVDMPGGVDVITRITETFDGRIAVSDSHGVLCIEGVR